MPDPTVPAPPSRTNVWATADLGDDARVTVTASARSDLLVTVGSTEHTVQVYGTPPVLHRITTDLLAQLDAIEAGQ